MMHYPYDILKIGPCPFGEAAYRARASALVLAGLCSVKWVKSTNVSMQSMFMGVNDTWVPPDKSVRDVHRDLCTHGLALAKSRADMEDRLLAAQFPAEQWTSEETLHCGT